MAPNRKVALVLLVGVLVVYGTIAAVASMTMTAGAIGGMDDVQRDGADRDGRPAPAACRNHQPDHGDADDGASRRATPTRDDGPHCGDEHTDTRRRDRAAHGDRRRADGSATADRHRHLAISLADDGEDLVVAVRYDGPGEAVVTVEAVRGTYAGAGTYEVDGTTTIRLPVPESPVRVTVAADGVRRSVVLQPARVPCSAEEVADWADRARNTSHDPRPILVPLPNENCRTDPPGCGCAHPLIAGGDDGTGAQSGRDRHDHRYRWCDCRSRTDGGRNDTERRHTADRAQAQDGNDGERSGDSYCEDAWEREGHGRCTCSDRDWSWDAREDDRSRYCEDDAERKRDGRCSCWERNSTAYGGEKDRRRDRYRGRYPEEPWRPDWNRHDRVDCRGGEPADGKDGRTGPGYRDWDRENARRQDHGGHTDRS